MRLFIFFLLSALIQKRHLANYISFEMYTRILVTTNHMQLFVQNGPLHPVFQGELYCCLCAGQHHVYLQL